jgi:hypothetical protein
MRQQSINLDFDPGPLAAFTETAIVEMAPLATFTPMTPGGTGKRFLRVQSVQVKQIEVIEITAETALPQPLRACASRISFLSLPTRSERLLNSNWVFPKHEVLSEPICWTGSECCLMILLFSANTAVSAIGSPQNSPLLLDLIIISLFMKPGFPILSSLNILPSDILLSLLRRGRGRVPSGPQSHPNAQIKEPFLSSRTPASIFLSHVQSSPLVSPDSDRSSRGMLVVNEHLV